MGADVAQLKDVPSTVASNFNVHTKSGGPCITHSVTITTSPERPRNDNNEKEQHGCFASVTES